LNIYIDLFLAELFSKLEMFQTKVVEQTQRTFYVQ